MNRGPRYALIHALTLYRLKRALLDVNAKYGVELYSGTEKVVVLPQIKIDLDHDCLCGKIRIRNHIKYNLENVNLSSALGRYIVETQYLSDDENWWIFEIEDSQTDRRLVFNSYKDFQKYCQTQDDYSLFVDKKLTVPIASLLLVGSTGTGKTYSAYSLVLQFLNWKIKPTLYFADPKNSSLCVMGKKISPERTAGTIDEIIEQLEAFHVEMEKRKAALQEKLEERLDADFRDWQMPAYIFIFDEYAAFQSAVNTLDKRVRDRISRLMRDIVLEGRQLGFFVWILMQKSDSTDIPTAIRDNLIFKVVLGSATNTTYMTAFEHAADLPKRKYGPGQGLYFYQGLTQKPKITSFPTLRFDILAATNEAVNGAPGM